MKRSLFTLFWIIPFLSFAQSNFQKGYVVTISNDTLKGFVDYREGSLTPSSVSFRSDLDAQIQNFSPKQCLGYGVDGLEQYKRFTVNISNNPIDIRDISDRADTTFVRDTVFLEVLQSGRNVALLSYQDKIKKRFYILENGQAEPSELIKILHYKEGYSGALIENDKYKRQLLMVMRKFNNGLSPDEQRLNNLKYQQPDLLKIVSIINGERIVRNKVRNTRVFIGLGLNVSRASYSGAHDLAGSDAVVKNFYLPMLATGIDVFANPAIGKLILRLELAVLMNKGDISRPGKPGYTSNMQHKFDQYTASLIPQVIYNFYNSPKLKFFGSLGLGINFSMYKNNKSIRIYPVSQEPVITKDQVILEKFNFSAQGKLGIVVGGRYEMSIGYIPKSSITDYLQYNVAVQRFTVGVNYSFGKF